MLVSRVLLNFTIKNFSYFINTIIHAYIVYGTDSLFWKNEMMEVTKKACSRFRILFLRTCSMWNQRAIQLPSIIKFQITTFVKDVSVNLSLFCQHTNSIFLLLNISFRSSNLLHLIISTKYTFHWIRCHKSKYWCKMLNYPFVWIFRV